MASSTRPEQPARRLVRLPRELDELLRKEAENEGVSANTLIVGALASFLGWREDSFDRWLNWLEGDE